MIIILEKEKITEKVKHKLLKKGLSLVGMSDKDIIFNKIKPHLPSIKTKLQATPMTFSILAV
jgi:hypothetical protein